MHDRAPRRRLRPGLAAVDDRAREAPEGAAARPPGRGARDAQPVYVDDLVEGIIRAATTPAAVGRIFTVTGAEPVTIGDFVAHYCRMLGIDRPRTVPAPVARAVARRDRLRRPGARGANEVTPAAIDYFLRRGTYSIARAREVLGYEPAVTSRRACGAPRSGCAPRGALAAGYIGAPRFEPGTSPTRTVRATRLRYAPMTRAYPALPPIIAAAPSIEPLGAI